MDDEILQDFLVEAGELLSALDNQLVELEARPEDRELLNAIFRAFHTIKGGAGFLGVDALVGVCHITENVFNQMRNGELAVTPARMDVILQAYDSVSAMLAQLRAGETATPAGQALLDRLAACLEEPAAATHDTPADWPSKPEFEALQAAVAEPAPASDSDEMTDDEFEALLDQLQGPAGKAPGVPETPKPVVTSTSAPAEKPAEKAATPVASEESTLRVDTKRLDEVMNLVGELVLVRNRILTIEGRGDREGMDAAAAHLDLVTAALQSAIMKTRMQPIKKIFGRFPRLVRDLAKSLNKDIELTLIGEDTELDKNLVEELADPLVHLVRNAVDHGIEPIAERGTKARTGRVTLAAQQEGDHILIIIRDDGRGMDPAVLRRKAVEKGLMDAESAQRLDDRQAFQLVFLPGFSTKDQISDISGRGVGMDVVKTNIARLNGAVEIQSELGVGTSFIVRLPLTLAIIPTLMVGLGEQVFAMPLSVVQEIFQLDQVRTHQVDGRQVALVRGAVLPLVNPASWLGIPQDAPPPYVVVAHVGDRRLGLLVDRLYGQEEVVIKSMGGLLHQVNGFAGATITGDGQVVLILDLAALLVQHGI